MSRNKKSNKITFSKNKKKTKGGYYTNKNGVPLDRDGNNVYKTRKFNY